jgi:galactonate dehydratase
MIPATEAAPRVRITGIELLPVRATERTVWLFIRLLTDAGIVGLGEASDAFGFQQTSAANASRMERELRQFFTLVEGRPPWEVESYLQRAENAARAGGLISATASSSIEQALWDLSGKAFDVPTYDLLGGPVRTSLPVYANINRATRPRTPSGFAASTRKAVAQGFRALKAAPFDGFPSPDSPAGEISAWIEQGVACMAAIRDAAGPDVALMVDCHSFFDLRQSIEVARRLEPFDLTWYEEPVAPSQVEDTLAIRRSIRQQMAGGETLFGLDGFLPLCREKAVHVIMPDVKHCGGLLALTRIAAMAAASGVEVAPHNPAGPVSTAASAQVCAGMKNFRILEFQWGEVDWRADLVRPAERFVGGTYLLPSGPGFGIELDLKVAGARRLA